MDTTTVDLVISDIEVAMAKLKSAYRKACRGLRTPGTDDLTGGALENVLLNIIDTIKMEIEISEHALCLAAERDRDPTPFRSLPLGPSRG